jgi:hypothetical protein
MNDHAVTHPDIAPPALSSPAVVAGDKLAAEDPEGALRMALAGEIDPTIPPQDMVLSWLLRLPGGLDPAAAARRVIAATDPSSVANPRLLTILAEVARWPAVRLRRLGRVRMRTTQ